MNTARLASGMLPAPLSGTAKSRPAPVPPSSHRTASGILVACVLHLLAAIALVTMQASPGHPVESPRAPIAIRLISAAPSPPAPAKPAEPVKTPRESRPIFETRPAPSLNPPRTSASSPQASPPAPSNAAESTASPAAPPATSAAVAAPREVAPAVTAPRFDAAYLANPAPAYPGMSRRLGETGRVLLRVKVSPDGLALDVSIAQGSGSARLDEAARDAVRQWRFVPARQGEQAVVASVNVPIVFTLKATAEKETP